MQVLVVTPVDGEIVFEERKIVGELSELQCIVGGLIEFAGLVQYNSELQGIACLVNEEGKLEGLEPTIAVIQNGTDEIIDILVGPCVFLRETEDSWATLTPEDIEKIKTQIAVQAKVTTTGVIEVQKLVRVLTVELA